MNFVTITSCWLKTIKIFEKPACKTLAIAMFSQAAVMPEDKIN